MSLPPLMTTFEITGVATAARASRAGPWPRRRSSAAVDLSRLGHSPVARLRRRNGEGGQSQGAGNSGDSGTNTHVFPGGEGDPWRVRAADGPQVVDESDDSTDPTAHPREWLCPAHVFTVKITHDGQSNQRSRASSSVRDGSSSSAATSKRRGHWPAAQARPAATPSSVAAWTTPSGVRRQSSSTPPATQFARARRSCRGPGAEQDPYGLRHLVLLALRRHLRLDALAEPPHLEQLRQLGRPRRGDRQQRQPAGQRQQVGGVRDHGVRRVDDPHLVVHDGPQLVGQRDLFGVQFGERRVERVQLYGPTGRSSSASRPSSSAAPPGSSRSAATDVRTPRARSTCASSKPVASAGVVQARQAADRRPPRADRPGGGRRARGGRAATTRCTGRTRLAWCRPAAGPVPAAVSASRSGGRASIASACGQASSSTRSRSRTATSSVATGGTGVSGSWSRTSSHHTSTASSSPASSGSAKSLSRGSSSSGSRTTSVARTSAKVGQHAAGGQRLLAPALGQLRVAQRRVRPRA